MIQDTAVIPFAFQNREIRVVVENGEPLFVAADVCGALGLPETHKAVARLDKDEKGRTLIPTLGGTQEMTTVNEPGLYSLVMRSRKPEAKTFRRWVTHEVLPAVRKTGKYSAFPAGNIRTAESTAYDIVSAVRCLGDFIIRNIPAVNPALVVGDTVKLSAKLTGLDLTPLLAHAKPAPLEILDIDLPPDLATPAAPAKTKITLPPETIRTDFPSAKDEKHIYTVGHVAKKLNLTAKQTNELLVRLGYIRRDPDTGKWALTPAGEIYGTLRDITFFNRLNRCTIWSPEIVDLLRAHLSAMTINAGATS